MSESGTKDSGCILRMAASDRIPRRMFSLARAFFVRHVLGLQMGLHFFSLRAGDGGGIQLCILGRENVAFAQAGAALQPGASRLQQKLQNHTNQRTAHAEGGHRQDKRLRTVHFYIDI